MSTGSGADQRSRTLSRGMITGAVIHSTGCCVSWSQHPVQPMGRRRASRRRQVQNSFRESSLGSRTGRFCVELSLQGRALGSVPSKACSQHLPGWAEHRRPRGSPRRSSRLVLKPGDDSMDDPCVNCFQLCIRFPLSSSAFYCGKFQTGKSESSVNTQIPLFKF